MPSASQDRPGFVSRWRVQVRGSAAWARGRRGEGHSGPRGRPRAGPRDPPAARVPSPASCRATPRHAAGPPGTFHGLVGYVPVPRRAAPRRAAPQAPGACRASRPVRGRSCTAEAEAEAGLLARGLLAGEGAQRGPAPALAGPAAGAARCPPCRGALPARPGPGPS